MPQIEPLGAGEPRQIGPFRVAGRIGEGGQGVVYLGEDDAGERVAIKLLHVRFSGDAIARSRFAREARAAQRVASFCTAAVVAADLEGDVPYIASEYIEGRPLREVVEAGGPLRGSALQRLAVGTATALTAIHHAAIVHRDLKPDNVLMAADGPRVVDFGIARIIDSTGTITSRAVGTPAYMAPEQIAGDDVGPYTDVFAWGATIMFAATGKTVFAGDSIAVVLSRILTHEVDVDMMPEPLRGTVRAALAKDPAERPSSEQILLRLLGRPEEGNVSPALLTQGAQVASPPGTGGAAPSPGGAGQETRPAGAPAEEEEEAGEATSVLRVPGSRTPPPPAGTRPSGLSGGTGDPRTQPQPAVPGDPHTGPPDPYGVPRAHSSGGAPRTQPAPHPALSDGARASSPAAYSHPAPPPAASRAHPAPPPPPASRAHPAPPPPDRPGAYPSHPGYPAATGPADPAGIGGPSWQETRPVGSGASRPTSRPRRGRWIALAVAVLLLGGAATAYATGWRPPFLAEAAGPSDGPTAPSGGSLVDRVATTKKLTVGMRDFLPGVALQNDGTWTGFEVDLAKEIAEALHVPRDGVTFRATSLAERPKLLASGELDLVIATYPINDRDEVTFAGPYYLAHVDVLVKADSPIRSMADLRGGRLCAPKGGTAADVVRERVGTVTLVGADNYAACMNKLVAGDVDAVPGDDLVLAGYADPAREATPKRVVGLKLTDERYAVALRKGDERACNAIRGVIADLYATGRIKQLLDEHFPGVEFPTRQDEAPALADCG
ncbi:protein kinase [Planomonospora corallina]|uniref:Protein kinase n=1 Tax=Planomonospora corallina TaxID=1806052 RepID=A0ABV8I3Y7_9ACTN